MAGGADNKLPEILTSNSSTKIKLQIPTLPEIQSEIQSCSMFKQDGNIMACITDPNNTWCLELYKGDWKIHSILKNQRDGQNSVVDTEFATFIFGGSDENHRTYEYLPKGSKTWKIGKNKIPVGFVSGFAIEVKSKNEILLLGGTLRNKIVSFDIKSHKFELWGTTLIIDRSDIACAFIPGTTSKILVTGKKI